MARLALCATSCIFVLLCSALAQADWARYGSFKVMVELRRMNAPDLPRGVLEWLHAETRSPEWRGALDIKEQGGQWAYRVRLRVAADGSTDFGRISAVSATVNSVPAGEFERSSFFHTRHYYFASWADLVSAFPPGAFVRFTVTVDGEARSGTAWIHPFSEADFPELAVVALDEATLQVTTDEPDQWSTVSVWTQVGRSREHVLEDEPIKGFGNAVTVAVPMDRRRPDATYIHEVEAGDESGYGLSRGTVMYGTLVEGSNLAETRSWPARDLKERIEDAAVGMLSCTLAPAAGLGLDALLLPAVAVALWRARRMRR